MHFKIISVCFKVFVECNATKIFSPCNYPSDNSDQITNTKLWLKRILLKFQYTEEQSKMCKGELLGFTQTLQHECENKTHSKFGTYVVAIWNDTQIGLNLCNFGRKLYSFHQV